MTENEPLPPALAELSEGVKHWVARFAEPIMKAETFEWEGDDGDQFYDFLIRSVVRRQYEAVAATVKMTEGGFGFFAVTMLRPAYEEMVWLAYLKKHSDLANELVSLLVRKELCDNLEAQNDYLKVSQMAAVGFTQRHLKLIIAKNKPHLARLKEIGRSLNWRDGALMPPFAFIARQVGREKQYNYLYQATSRFVHFSVQENMRRVWGKSGKVTIASSNFSGYWSAFALSWGMRIFLDTYLHTDGVFNGPHLDESESEKLSNWLSELTHVPIITAEELQSWDRRRKS